VSVEELEALDAIQYIIDAGCRGMFAAEDGPLTAELAEAMVERGLIAGELMAPHPELGSPGDDPDEERMAYWLTGAGRAALDMRWTS
jgi:hypothetical protein